MKVIQNFSSGKHITTFPIFDIMIWIAGVNQLKKLGYSTKLYCEERDLDWLRKWHLLDLYDEIDTEVLASISWDGIQQDKFWSVRKLYCINHEMSLTASTDFFYMDTDIVLMRPLQFTNPQNGKPCDLFVWSPDPYTEHSIYCDLHYLSTPPGYTMPTWFLEANLAFNCGILYFRTQEMWQTYFKEYLNFVVNNPCTFKVKPQADSEETMRNVWACNSEQRLLAGLARYKHWCLGAVMGEVGQGSCPIGVHFYIVRALWRQQRRGAFDKYPDADKEMTQAFCGTVRNVRKFITDVQWEPFNSMPWVQSILNGNNSLRYQ